MSHSYIRYAPLVALRFDGDCDECLVEAWERMTYGGLGFGEGSAYMNTLPCALGGDRVSYFSGIRTIYVSH